MGNAEEVTVKMRKHRQIKTQAQRDKELEWATGKKMGGGEI